MKPTDRDSQAPKTNTFMDDLNRELLHAEHDTKTFKKRSKHIRNFIRNQETQDGNIKKTRGNSYWLLKRIAELPENAFEGIPVSADLKSILESNKRHRPQMLMGLNLNQLIGEKQVHHKLKEWIDDCRRSFSDKSNRALTQNQTLNRKRRKEKMSQPLAIALKEYPRILTVRVDIAYSNYTASNRDINADLERLRRNMKRNKSLSGGLIFGIIKTEFGLIKGPHAHLLLVYDGNTRWRDDRIGELIGTYWKDVITAGTGTHFNANRKKSKENLSIRTGIPENQLGIGMLKKGDTNKIKNLDTVIEYLSKDDQRMISQPGKRLRSFRTFTMPSDRGQP